MDNLDKTISLYFTLSSMKSRNTIVMGAHYYVGVISSDFSAPSRRFMPESRVAQKQ